MLLAELKALVPKMEVVRKGRRGGVHRRLGMSLGLVVVLIPVHPGMMGERKDMSQVEWMSLCVSTMNLKPMEME